jgi:carboxylesterase type B
MFQLMNTHPNFYAWKHLQQSQEPLTAWSPRVDPEAAVAFLPQEPIDLMTAGNFQHVPWVAGITDDEGATRAYAFLEDKEGVVEWEEKFPELGPLLFGLHDGQSEAPKVMAKKVRDFYLGPGSMEAAGPAGLVDAISDSSYAHPVDTAAKVHALKSAAPVFVYHFGYRGKHSQTHVRPNEFPPVLEKPEAHYGVGNGDDLMYLFPILMGLFRPLPSEDIAFSMRMVELMTSFARHGKPSLAMGEAGPPFLWDPVSAANASHLNIGNIMAMDQGLPNHQRMSFWGGLPVYWNADRTNYKPSPPIERKEEL